MMALKDFFLHKLTLRVLYIGGAFTASNAVAFLASPRVQQVLNHAGLNLQVTDPEAFKSSITAGLLIAGEFVFHITHEKVILPHVAPEEKG